MDIDRIAKRVVDRDDLLNELASAARKLRWRAHELRRLRAAPADEDEWRQEQAYIVARAFEAGALQLEQVGRLPASELSLPPSRAPSLELAAWDGSQAHQDE